jgi:hypothetical protein
MKCPTQRTQRRKGNQMNKVMNNLLPLRLRAFAPSREACSIYSRSFNFIRADTGIFFLRIVEYILKCQVLQGNAGGKEQAINKKHGVLSSFSVLFLLCGIGMLFLSRLSH